MNEISFEVQGSAKDPYEVRFVRRDKNNLSAYCSCPAGQNGQYCKHRLNIFEGNSKGIVSDNADQVAIVQSWLPNTDVENALGRLRSLEKLQAEVKKDLAAAKKAIARMMLD